MSSTAERIRPLDVAVVISGRGSNMLAIAAACRRGDIHARVVRVIADRPSAAGLAAAAACGLDTRLIPASEYAARSDFETALAASIDGSGAQLVALAGFMRILTPAFTTHYAGRLLNIHPSLLPDYRGLHTHQRVLDAGEAWHGVTVHYVTAELDGGPRILQARIAVRRDDTAETLSARIQQREHVLYPRVVGWIAADRLQWRDGLPWFDGGPLREPLKLEECDP
jgi:phosphoribosylglycinamide formyltransferase-1